MPLISHNPAGVSAPVGGYSHALKIKKGSRYLFISGQIPERPDGVVPQGFEAQCEAVWSNIEKVLSSARMGIGKLVKITTFLTEVSQVEANGEIRRRHLGEARPALTVIIAQTLETEWLLEIEAIAAADE